MAAGAPKKNKNAERWDIKTATEFMEKAAALSRKEGYDFIGEIAYDLGEDKSVFNYITDKFPELNRFKVRLKNNCEVNCFRSLKKEGMPAAVGIVNLKANHGWIDRQQLTHKIAPVIKIEDSTGKDIVEALGKFLTDGDQ